ncbi:MAG: hypothetical protein FWC46_09665 [Actinomycetia bacterium]|nr:hypothetical protein [Actinomycetes bacterium]
MSRGKLLSWVGAGALVLAAGTAGGVALALWAAHDATVDRVAGQAVAGFAVTKDGLTDVASGGADTVSFTIGEAEATALVDAGPDANGAFAVAVPFDVTLLVSAGYGMDYTIDIATPPDGTVFGLPGTGPVFFPVSDPGACTVAEAGNVQTSVAPVAVNGLAAGGTGAPTARADHWCLVVSVNPPTYGGAAVADGTSLLDTSESSTPDNASLWAGYVIPDSALEPPLTVTLAPASVAV